MATFLDVMPGSIVPKICVEVDFDHDPTSGTTTWTDVTDKLVSYSRQPVRRNEFDQPTPAAGQLVLRDDTGDFIPDNTTGTYYGKLKKYRRVRVRAQWGTVTYNRFWGYVTDWPQNWDEFGRDQKVTLPLSDALTPLASYDLGGQDLASASSGSALAAVLNLAGIAAQDLDAGQSTIADTGTLISPSYALRRVNDIAASENGVCFADGGGTIQFHDRKHRLLSSATAVGTIGDATGEIPYIGPTPEYGDVWPVVRVTAYGGTTETTKNAAGTAAFFQQTLLFPPSGQYLVSSQAEALAASQYLSGRYSTLSTRVTSVTLVPARDTSTWPTALSLDTSMRVQFRRRFLAGATVAGTVDAAEFVEGYGDQVTIGQDWRVNLSLSSVDLQSYWLLGDNTYSRLGGVSIGY